MICKWIGEDNDFDTSQGSFVCSQLNGFKYSKLLNCSIWPIDGTLTSNTIMSQSGTGSNGN